MERQSEIRGRKLYWGEPTIKIGDTVLEPPSGFTPLLIADNDIDDGRNVPFWVGDHEYNVSFDMELDKASFKSIRRMFVFRIPRKKKKAIKKEFEKRFGVNVKKLRFNNRLFNLQKRQKNGR